MPEERVLATRFRSRVNSGSGTRFFLVRIRIMMND